MDALITSYCLSLLLLISILGTSAGSNETNSDERREPRVSGRIVKLYSGAKPEPYLCRGEGFQADPTNCAVFYRCVQERSGKFTVFRYQCAPGTVYDPDVETCNHPRNTRRSECGGMLKPTVEPFHSTNINEIEGAQSEIPRPISTKVPIYTERTTLKLPTTLSWILTTDRQNTPTKMQWISTSNSSPSILGQQKTTQLPSSTTEHQWFSPDKFQAETLHQPIAQNNDLCTSNGFMGDSENCRKFYRCVGNQRGGFIKYEFSCSELTVWDDEIQGCNHPWAVKRIKCGRSMSYNDKSTSLKPGSDPTETPTISDPIINNGEYGKKSNKTIQQQLQISHRPTVTQTQTQISNSNQVIQNQTQINYGDKIGNNKNSGSKQNQTQISHESAISQTQTQIDHGHKEVQTQLQIDHSKDSSQSQVQIQESTTAHHLQSSTSQHNNGKNECSESGFMGDVEDCKKFYRCVDNGRGTYTRFEFSCGDGTVWDPEIEACNHAWAVKNCGSKIPVEPVNNGQTNSTTTTTIKTTEYLTQDTKTTQSYYPTTTKVPDVDDEDDVGYGNQNNQETTSSSTTTMKTPTTSTTPPTATTKTTTKKPSGPSTECTSSGFIGDENDCKLFYRCVDNGQGSFTKYEFRCGDGTLWDPEIEACNHAWAVKNCGGSSSSNGSGQTSTTTTMKSTEYHTEFTKTTESYTTSQVPDVDDEDDVGYGNQNNQEATPSSTTTTTTMKTTTEKSNGSFVCLSSGFFGDANDCKIFYRCVDNGQGTFTKYEFSCGDGTLWDPEIEACNHAWAVKNCGGSSSATLDKEETTTKREETMPPSNGQTTLTLVQITTQAPPENDDYDTGYGSQNNELSTSSTTTIRITTAEQLEGQGGGKPSECKYSGFMGDENDCKKFYRCVDSGTGNYIRYEFICGDGTVWDPQIEACNHAWAVEKCGGINTEYTENPSQSIPTTSSGDSSSMHTTEVTQTDSPDITTPSTTSSATGSSESRKCSNSGFMGDDNDCKKFYRCVDNGDGSYTRYEFACGEGTVWDPKIETCNHAWAVEKCGGSSESTHVTEQTTSQHPVLQSDEGQDNGYGSPSFDSSEDGQTQQSTERTTTTTQPHQEVTGDKCVQEGFFGNQRDCKKFYRCVEDGKGGFTKYEFTCGEGTAWNQDMQACDHASPDSPCGEETHINNDINTETTSTTKTTTFGGETESTQATKKPESQGTCESEGFYGNPSDCKKFYRCVNNGNGGYTKYDFNCGDGTVWNQEIQACDHESTDKTCTNTASSQTPASSVSSQTSVNESQTESTTTAYSTTKKHESTNDTGNECTSEGFFAHSHDCKKFIRCVNNGNGGFTKYEFSCGDGTVWVQEIQACDHDNDVNSCRAQNESTSKPQNNGEHSTTSDSSVMSSTESMTPNKEDDEYDDTSKEPSHDETEDCTSEGYFPNKHDCRKFYRCVKNGNGGYTKYDFTCGEGTAWDSDQQTCNHINQVKTCSGSPQEGSNNQQTSTSKNEGETESASGTTETSYSTTKTSSSSSESSGGSSSNSQDTCENEGYYGDSKDCTKFYRCVDNGKGGYTKYDFTCGDGTIWDQDITTCNHPQDVSNPSCSSEQGSSDTTSTTSSATSSSSQTTSSTTESSSGSSSSSQSTSDCSQESSKKPGKDDITCDRAGYYANPNDCKKFYRCVDWDGDGKKFSVFHFECGEGTIWDPALDTCNHEDSVYPRRDCSQPQSQNVGGETTTTEGTTSSTTDQSTTGEQTTTQDSATSEHSITTQKSTTTEKSTTQQSTTEQTTTEQSTNETTTTQESTSSATETTTTQDTTTSEQTTTQQSTTSENTTTQESTTSKQTTTQQPATSEQTTTQQTATSEQSTTQQSTSSEQTTTEQNTNEQTTTQQSTTSEKTTTQESTTNAQTTTQESTTSEHTTTTTEQTQESTTNEQTTQQLTSEQPTTQQSTTSQQTTEQSTTTTEQTTEGTTTEETTDQSTTQASTTESNSTEDQSTTESTSTESSTTESSSSDKECPETDGDQYLLVCPTSFKRHPKYCNMFYQCTEDDETYEAKVATFKCPNNTIYDESKTQCVTEDKADKKCDGQIANKRRFKRLGSHYKDPIEADKGKQYSCSATGYFSFEKHSECSKGFLRCDQSKNGKLTGHVYQCPEGFIYWSISKRCERTESVRDCKKSSNDWTERWNIPVERKNIARS